jgi:hypothetical protein
MSIRKCIGYGLLAIPNALGISSLLFADSTVSTSVTAPSASVETTAAVPASTDNSWTGGRLPFHISVTLGEVYDSNIFFQPNKTSDFITQLGVRGEIKFGDQEVTDGNYLDGYYAPSGALYADHSSEDFLNQDVDLLYQHRFTRLTLSLEQSYTKTTATSFSIGNLVTSNIYTTNAKATYAYSDKVEINSSFSQVFTDYNTAYYTSSREWINDEYFLYKLDSKLSIGIGQRFGFLDFEGAPFQTYQQLLPRLKYDYSGRLTFQLAAGAEYRQYNQSGRADRFTGVFELSGTYQPFLDTTISLRGSRHYVPAYGFNDEDYLATNVSLTGRQKFLKEFYFNLGLGYENDSYLYNGTGFTGPNREDNYYFATTGLDWDPNTWLVVSSYYKYQKDASNFSAFSFDDNQVGFSIEASY